MGDVSPDTWYWATESRGYNIPFSECYAPDRFTVNILGTIKEYHWEGSFTDGHVLRDEVRQEGIMNGCHLLVNIPAGTIINEDAIRGYDLKLKCYQDVITVETSPAFLTFSQPVIIYRMADGDWVEVAAFAEVVNGQQL